jgi:hypothetical protein
VVAVFLGLALFGGRLVPAEIGGMLLILIAVATVILSRTRVAPPPTDPLLEQPIKE